MFAILSGFGNLEYSTVFSVAPLVSNNVITFTGICLFIGAMAKSSQIGQMEALKIINHLIYYF
jgi:NADH-ubiquinone oxidoreductase chain 5